MGKRWRWGQGRGRSGFFVLMMPRGSDLCLRWDTFLVFDSCRAFAKLQVFLDQGDDPLDASR